MNTHKNDRQHDSRLLAKRANQIQGGSARAAVLGANDGLVSVLCLVLGVAAAGAPNSAVLLAGFAGLIAGAISMAAGEWISVKSQAELFEGVIKDLRHLVQHDRQILADHVADNLAKSGQADATAKQAAEEIARDDSHLSDVYSRQVMGFNPDELGSPWGAAFSSLALFTAGGLMPLVAWFFVDGWLAIVWSLGLTGLASLVVGAYIAKSSGKRQAYGALRQLAVVVFAAAVTYGIGYLFGVTLV